MRVFATNVCLKRWLVPPTHAVDALREKFDLFVRSVLVSGVSITNINIPLCLAVTFRISYCFKITLSYSFTLIWLSLTLTHFLITHHF